MNTRNTAETASGRWTSGRRRGTAHCGREGRAPRHRASLSLAHHLPRMIARAAGMALVIATAVSLTAADSTAPGVAVSFAILAAGSPLRRAAASPGGESAHETASLLGSSYAPVRLGRMMRPRNVVGIAAKAPALKTDDDAGRTDAYLAGQTGGIVREDTRRWAPRQASGRADGCPARSGEARGSPLAPAGLSARSDGSAP